MTDQQVLKNHYDFLDYCQYSRWSSYWHQITSTLKYNPKSVLIVGEGDGIVQGILNKQVEEVHSLDIAADLNPDYVASVLEINSVLERKYDVIICCQVLEHIPLNKLDSALHNLRQRCSHLILSLPYCHFNLLSLNIRLPKGLSLNLSLKIPKFYKRWQFDGEHYWEIGTKGVSQRKISTILDRHFKQYRKFFSRFNSYHLFYELESKPIN